MEGSKLITLWLSLKQRPDLSRTNLALTRFDWCLCVGATCDSRNAWIRLHLMPPVHQRNVRRARHAISNECTALSFSLFSPFLKVYSYLIGYCRAWRTLCWCVGVIRFIGAVSSDVIARDSTRHLRWVWASSMPLIVARNITIHPALRIIFLFELNF